jgi:integrase
MSMRDGIIDTSASLADALDRYAAEVSPKHKGARWERMRLNAIKRLTIAQKRLSAVSPSDLALWRDKRLQEVSAGTVRREMGLLGAVFDTAVREWLWLKRNPMKSVRKPPTPQPRERILSQDEVNMLTEQLSGQYRDIFLLALETGMRLGEICGIRGVDIYADFVRLHDTKNGTSRDVPLSKRARELVREFDTTPANASAVF